MKKNWFIVLSASICLLFGIEGASAQTTTDRPIPIRSLAKASTEVASAKNNSRTAIASVDMVGRRLGNLKFENSPEAEEQRAIILQEYENALRAVVSCKKTEISALRKLDSNIGRLDSEDRGQNIDIHLVTISKLEDEFEKRHSWLEQAQKLALDDSRLRNKTDRGGRLLDLIEKTRTRLDNVADHASQFKDFLTEAKTGVELAIILAEIDLAEYQMAVEGVKLAMDLHQVKIVMTALGLGADSVPAEPEFSPLDPDHNPLELIGLGG